MEPTIKDFLKAGYPALFLRTVEPQTAERLVRKACSELQMDNVQFGVWKATTGLMVNKVNEKPETARKAQDDLLDALIAVQNAKPPSVMVALFHNVRHFINNYQVIQQLHDTIMAARLVGGHVILVGPQLDLPSELKNLVTFVDVPLPTREQIVEEYKRLTRAYKDAMHLPKKEEEVESLLVDAATSAIGLDMIGAESAFALSVAVKKTVDLRLITAQKEQEVRKSDVLEFVNVSESMDEVGGMAALKEWLKRRAKAFTEDAREYGLPFPKGILTVGPAGTGKSLVSKAVAAYLKLPLLRLDMGKIFRSLQGESEAAIRLALQVAEAVAPVVLWLDEIDKGLAGMKGSGELDSGVTARVVSTILTWRQETKAAIFLAATANDVATIPSMVYRKGRVDEVWATDLPTPSERAEIFAIHLRKRGRDPEKFNIQTLVNATNNWVGAEIEAGIIDGMYSAFDLDEEVKTKHILRAIKETTPQAERNKEELRAIREWVATRARLASGDIEESAEAGTKIRRIRSTKDDD